ncbi:MAG: hypothetical protein ICV63_05615 [Coleofasciculus sp. Co-bin14]|nr:hypothetical protein [Coleofasciculus sp. Co-bin14]
MLDKIINLSLLLVIKEVDDVLKHCPEYPYQITFNSNPELRQTLINNVLSEIPHYYAIVEESQALPEDPRCIYASWEERLFLIIKIYERITDLFEENAQLFNCQFLQKRCSENERSFGSTNC